MLQAMYTQDTSHWYALLHKAQADSEFYPQPDVENHLDLHAFVIRTIQA